MVDAGVPDPAALCALLQRLRQSTTLLASFAQEPPLRAVLTHCAAGHAAAADALRRRQPENDDGERPPSTPATDPARPLPGAAPRVAAGDGDDAAESAMAALARCVAAPAELQVTLSDVAGAGAAAAALRQAVVLPLRHPQLFSGARRPWRSVLLYGPPGTGKTTIARAAAACGRSSFLSVTAADLLSKWVGDSEKLVRALFATAARHTPCVVFLDEVDALCGARGAAGESEAARRLKTEFLVRMMGGDAGAPLVIAATNLPWELDPAFCRRFERHVFVGLPDAAARAQLLRRAIAGAPHELTAAADVERVAVALHGCSGADVINAARHALMRPLERLDRATHFRVVAHGSQSAEALVPCAPTDDGAVAMCLDDAPAELVGAAAATVDDFVAAAAECPRTVTHELLDRYAQWERSVRPAS